MPDEEQVEAAKASAADIQEHEASQTTPRGNVHSEPDEGAPELDAPPPFSN